VLDDFRAEQVLATALRRRRVLPNLRCSHRRSTSPPASHHSYRART